MVVYANQIFLCLDAVLETARLGELVKIPAQRHENYSGVVVPRMTGTSGI